MGLEEIISNTNIHQNLQKQQKLQGSAYDNLDQKFLFGAMSYTYKPVESLYYL